MPCCSPCAAGRPCSSGLRAAAEDERGPWWVRGLAWTVLGGSVVLLIGWMTLDAMDNQAKLAARRRRR